VTLRGDWEALERPGPESVVVDGVVVRRGSRVRLAPRAGADVFDLALTGRVAVVEGIDVDLEDNVAFAVTIEDDPGRDLGDMRQPGHRFFFAADEIEPLGEADVATAERGARVLVAGIGNIFLGDDAFGVELAGVLRDRPLPAGAEVVDFGIRGMDLAYALGRGYDAVVFLDATPRGGAPGTVYVIEPSLDDVAPALDAHGMNPVQVLRLARRLDGLPPRALVVGCEPAVVMSGEEFELVGELSEPVRAALDEAADVVERLLVDLMGKREENA
jgi:hydrogenase maturation protease